jgi:hypothetical protein
VGVVIGYHPDQATEPIVDYALASGKPFVIVPCCVFARDFPHRRRPGPPGPDGAGREVSSYEDFVEYLRAKGSTEGAGISGTSGAVIGAGTAGAGWDGAGGARGGAGAVGGGAAASVAVAVQTSFLAYNGRNLVLHTLPGPGPGADAATE